MVLFDTRQHCVKKNNNTSDDQCFVAERADRFARGLTLFDEHGHRIVSERQHQFVLRHKALGEALSEHGFSLITGGTDNHLLLVDMTPKGLGGKPYAQALERAGIVCNYNSIPFDPRKPFDPSGIRIGTPSVTSRGMGVADMKQLAGWMDEVANSHEDEALLARIAGEVREVCGKHPAPGLPS